MAYSIYGKDSTLTNRADAGDKNVNKLPLISQGLDSVRTYQWELQLDLPATVRGDFGAWDQQKITLAAKQISGFGYKLADIEVHRVNDKVFYPGKLEQDELTVTFDNLLSQSMGKLFYTYLSTVYDMRTGHYNIEGGSVGSYKTSARILEFDGGGNIKTVVDLKGLYPKSFTKGEKNYSTNDFDTMEVKFRWDFMNIMTGEESEENIVFRT